MFTMARRDVERELRNLAEHLPLTRLRAIHELSLMLDELVDTAKLEQIRKARGRKPPSTWDEIGHVIGWTGVHARRIYGPRL